MPFSVMIPCHNPDPGMLDQCLSSVRSQLPLSEHQVCVVDDRSDDPEPLERLARRYAAELVRTDEELGGVLAHNLCLQLAEHDLVHLLHPDDWVLSGFYEAIAAGARLLPNHALYCTAALVVDPAGRPQSAQNLPLLLGGQRFTPLHHGNPLCVAACVSRRSFYQEHGGWLESLYHTADWEYWARCTIKGGICTHDWPLACWRVHPQNHSNRLARRAANLRNYLRCGEAVSAYMEVDWPQFRAYIAGRARGQAAHFRAVGDLTAVAANEELAREVEVMA